MLVHGPLLVTLMLRLVEAHEQSLPQPQHVLQSIEYRNFAPLHCDEKMRLCGRSKPGASTDNSRIYDVWIEGPTGGMAVKGTVRTAPMPTPESSEEDQKPAREVYESILAKKLEGKTSGTSPPILTRREKRMQRAVRHGLVKGVPFPTAEEARRRILASRKEAATTISENTTSEHATPVRRIIAPPGPLISVISPQTREIARRLGLTNAEQSLANSNLKLLPLVRKYDAQEAKLEPLKSRLEARGVKKVEIRPMHRYMA